MQPERPDQDAPSPERDISPEHGPDRDRCSGFALPKVGKVQSSHPERDTVSPEWDKIVPRSINFENFSNKS